MRIHASVVILAVSLLGVAVVAQQPATDVAVAVKPIEPPLIPLPPESESARVTRFSFVAYGDTRSGSEPGVPGDGEIVQKGHTLVMDRMLATVRARASTPFPVRFVVQSGDAVLRGANAVQWNTSFTPIIERLTRRAGVPYFPSAGNHDVSGMPLGSAGRAPGLANTLTAISTLIPPDGSPRRLDGYPSYALGYGNVFVIALDSNIAGDPTQLAWVTKQLEGLDRQRYRHIVVVFHHPVYSSGPHGGTNMEPATVAMRELYMPLFRRHRVALLLTGHEHFFEHFIERYEDGGRKYRMDHIVTGGGGAPTYVYRAEPVLNAYLDAGRASNVTVEHKVQPGITVAANPKHFVVVEVDGERLSLEVVSAGAEYAPYGGRSRIELFDRAS